MSRTHLMIPDMQVKKGVPLNHVYALGNFIKEHQPDVIINIGDTYDMPSLSVYDMGKAKAEGKRYIEDIEAGNFAMEIINKAIKSVKKYDPTLVFCIGNHEERIARHVNAHPELVGTLGYHCFTALRDWQVFDYLELAEIDGVCYTHYLANPMSGKPIGGGIMNRIEKAGFSFSMGHIQKLDHGSKYLNNGGVLRGLIAGAFYLHDEDYKGPQGNNHFRGIVWKNNVKDGNYDLEEIRMETLLNIYGE